MSNDVIHFEIIQREEIHSKKNAFKLNVCTYTGFHKFSKKFIISKRVLEVWTGKLNVRISRMENVIPLIRIFNYHLMQFLMY